MADLKKSDKKAEKKMLVELIKLQMYSIFFKKKKNVYSSNQNKNSVNHI